MIGGIVRVRQRRGRRLPALAVVSALVFAACSGDESPTENDSNPNGPASPSTSAPADDEATEPESSADPGADDRGPDDSAPDDSASDDSVPDEVVEPARLADATLGQTSVVAFDRVSIDGLDLALAYESVAYLDGLDVLPRPVFVDEDGPFIIAPMHPTELDGETLDLHLEASGQVGPTLTLDITPPPAADGSFEAGQAALIGAIEHRARAAGLSLVELGETSYAELDPLVRHLKVALSWAELADDAAVTLAAAEHELLDSVAGAAGLPALFADEAVDIPRSLIDAPSGPAALGFVARQADDGCFHQKPTIETIDDLASAMLHASAAGSLASRSGQRGRALEVASWGISAGSFLPGLAGKTASVMGLQLAAFDAVLNGIAGLNPSRLTGLDAVVAPTTYEEDFSGTGFWRDVEVTAASDGWNADADAVNVLFNLIGVLAPGPQQADTLDEVIATLGDDEVLGVLGELTNQALNAQLQSLGPQVLRFCPETWTLPVNSPGYVEARVFGGHFDIDNDAFAIEPKRVAVDLLRIETLPAKFAGRYAKIDTVIESVPIEVTAARSFVYVDEPGDTVGIDVSIENAETPSMYWNPGAGSWADGIGDDANGSRTRQLRTPSNANSFPFDVRVESTTTSGLRRDRTPPRFTEVSVRIRPFFLTASPDEIRPDEPSELFAFDDDEQPVEVSWQSDGGRLVENGTGRATFTADEPGEYVVTATDARGEAVDVTIYVLGGECSFAYTIGGTRFIGQDGDVVTWSNRAERESRLLVGDPTGEGYGAQLTFTSDSGLRPQGAPVSGAGDYFIRFADFKVARDSPLGSSVYNSGEVEITTYEDGVMVAGAGAGEVVGDGGRIPFSIEFSVFDSGEHNFGAADFECYIERSPTAE